MLFCDKNEEFSQLFSPVSNLLSLSKIPDFDTVGATLLVSRD